MAPLKPDADLSKLGLKTGLQLSMTLLPPGQEIDPSYLTPHPIDRVGSQCLLLEQRVDAIESLILTHRGLDPQACQRLHQLCLWYGETGLKLMLKMDEIDGDASVKAARKALVKKVSPNFENWFLANLVEYPGPFRSQPPSPFSGQRPTRPRGAPQATICASTAEHGPVFPAPARGSASACKLWADAWRWLGKRPVTEVCGRHLQSRCK